MSLLLFHLIILINHSVYIMETHNNPFFHSGHRQPPSNHHHHHDHQLQQNFLKQPMFEKSLTPSDVGKLNRLVIPKQHAERYFPLGSGIEQQKGLLLSFEDESGNTWRFRYSYWNSSQSYVLTKGWSRYVKEKRLDAGDVVLFERHVSDCERFFIGWRRQSASVTMEDGMEAAVAQPVGGGAPVGEWSTTAFYDAQNNYPSHHHLPLPQYHSNCLHAGRIYENVDSYQRRVIVTTRRLRLFGVNLECPDESEPSTPDGSSHINTG